MKLGADEPSGLTSLGCEEEGVSAVPVMSMSVNTH